MISIPFAKAPSWYLVKQPRRRPIGRFGRIILSQMHVPSDSFGGISPERKAGEVLRTFFTFVAVRIIMAQMAGAGRGELGSYNAQGYSRLASFLRDHPLRTNGDEWLGKLMEEDEMLAVRVMEVRAAYASTDFEWDNCQRTCTDDLKAANVKLMRSHAEARFTAVMQPGSDQQGREENPESLQDR